MAEHTNLPWTISNGYLHDVSGSAVAVRSAHYPHGLERGVMAEKADANAAYIVKCVNCHDELDAALKLAGDYLANGDLSDLSIRDGVLAAITAARISGRL